MSQLNVLISTRRDDATLKSMFETPGAPAKLSIANKLSNFIIGAATGSELGPTGAAPSFAISIHGLATPASGTFTLTSAVATNTVVINGVTFTGVASGATGNQFNIGGTDTITAANIAAAINASVTALVSGYVTATSATNVVTVSSVFRSISGNQVTISSGAAPIVASGARLTGGAVDPTALTLNF